MNADTTRSPSTQLRVHFLTFLIAFVAGIAAAMLPRLVTGVSNTNLSEGIVLFPIGYIYMSLGFAVVIGAISTILMWNSPFDPPKIFMTSLGIPALLAGSLNSVATFSELDSKLQDVKRVQQAIEEQIQSQSGETLLVVPADEIDRSSKLPAGGSSNIQGTKGLEKTLDFELFRPAYAQESPSTPGNPIGSLLGGILKEPQYNVGISNLVSEEEAKLLQEKLDSTFEIYPSRDGSSFFLVNPAVMSKLIATIEALSLQNEVGLIVESIGKNEPTETVEKLSNAPRVIITPVTP